MVKIYLVSPETAAISALTRCIYRSRTLGDAADITLPEEFTINDNMIVPPADEKDMDSIEVLRGLILSPFPVSEPLTETIDAKCSLKRSAIISQQTILCLLVQRFCHCVQIFLRFPNSVSLYVTKSSTTEHLNLVKSISVGGSKLRTGFFRGTRCTCTVVFRC